MARRPELSPTLSTGPGEGERRRRVAFAPSPGVDRVAGALGLAVLLALGAWVACGSLQQDLAAYVTAGRARAAGLDPYLNHAATPGAPWDGVAVYRHSRFLYPPLVAELFRPLAALPYAWAKALFTAVSIAGLWLGLHLTRDGGAIGPARPASVDADRARPIGVGLVLLGAALWPPVFTTLERGQIDLLLLPLLALAWRARERPLAGGVPLALAALAKPFVLGLWPLLLVARRFRLLGGGTLALVALVGIGTAISGPALWRTYATQVLPRAAAFGEGGPEAWLLPEEAFVRGERQTEAGAAALDAGGRTFALQRGDFPRNASLARLLAGATGAPTPPAVVVYGALGALLAVAAARDWRRPSGGWWWGALLAGVAAAPVGWAMSLPLALPLGLTLFASGAPDRRCGVAVAIAYAAGVAGPFVRGAWCVAAAAGAVAGALLSMRRAAP